MTLELHTGGDPVDYDAQRDLPIPAVTSTHVPIPHHRVVDMLVHTLSFYGHEVIEQHHGITNVRSGRPALGRLPVADLPHSWRLV